MAVVEVRSVGELLDASISRLEMVSSSYGVSALQFTQLSRLSKLEVDLTFMILWAFRLFVLCQFRSACPDSGVAWPSYRLTRDSA